MRLERGPLGRALAKTTGLITGGDTRHAADPLYLGIDEHGTDAVAESPALSSCRLVHTARGRAPMIADAVELENAAGNLAQWQWPQSLRRLVIFRDADDAGRKAAETLPARALAGRLSCEVLAPSSEGLDWCDVWSSRDRAEVSA